ncbi:hypothetical protein P261_00216 [Lachnospiraceae bacterium TWA4]|nr:hypothetical protein P261_00216 [Lachnospiraceae bacterium TWA4]
MRGNEFLDKMDLVDPSFIESASQLKQKRKQPLWIKWGSIAACICLIIIGGVKLFNLFSSHYNGGFSQCGQAGHDEGSTFMSYNGPTLPLTILEKETNLTAKRHICFDFGQNTSSECSISDTYTLTNETTKDLTLTGIYPYIGSFETPNHPTIKVDGNAIQTTFYSGGYSGGFEGDGSDDPMDLNLKNPESWEDYRTILSNDHYRTNAFSPYPSLSQKATVYEFSNITMDENSAIAPTLGIQFHQDTQKTSIITYGFNGYETGLHDQQVRYSFFIPPESESDYQQPRYLIIFGEDIGNYTIQGYTDGGCDKLLPGVSADVKRYTCTLDEVLKPIATKEYSQSSTNNYINPTIDFSVYYGEFCRFFSLYSNIGSDKKERYEGGMLEDFFMDLFNQKRIFYRSFSLEIPANSSKTIAIKYLKYGSYNFYCKHPENAGIDGYDMLTRLGSTLNFTTQTASIKPIKNMEIVRQNFGFDLAKNITTVPLDLNKERYWLEVKVKLE